MEPAEPPSRIEPCFLENVAPELNDLTAELVACSTALAQALHPSTASSLAELVRIMNCYYSNLIEGHNTRPREIEEALEADDRRDLAIEARAHVRVQRMIDEAFARGELPEPASINTIQWLHREFYHDASNAMLTVKGAHTEIRLQPGEFRATPEEDVVVGRHYPPLSLNVLNFMRYFERRYRFEPFRQGSRILALASAHHRFNFIHPFADGNGRVSRLMSHAMALAAEIGAHGLWSVSRGLARGLAGRDDYRSMLALADSPREGDLDGRGNLSLRRLSEFTHWFLEVCLDQVRFMSGLFELEGLAERLLRSAADRPELHERSGALLEAVLREGAIQRGRVPSITGLKERASRNIVASLVRLGWLASDTPKGPLVLHIKIDLAEELFPKLFPESVR